MKLLAIVGLIFLALLVPIIRVSAFEITSDPQYIIMDFSQINELNWAAPEETWQKSIKPQIIAQIHEMRSVLPDGTPDRRLAWSTLMEYMNFPLDTPGPDSVYVKKLRRILEITEEEQLPVFVPLNGFQWWDELPELYNWWDPDGTKTPASFFARQDTSDFKERFIRGYNPENRWNVEWSDWDTPMKYNWRNWGGGGFVLAPPPNLLRQSRSPISYRQVLEARLGALLDELVKGLSRWEQMGKQDLFAGISIGTEVSLSASVTSANEYSPYGYRGMQDLLCGINTPECGIAAEWSAEKITATRQQVVRQYFEELAPLAIRRGIPKQRVYTHIGEFAPGDDRAFPYAPAAFTLYARPGLSLYAYAQSPFGHTVWRQAMEANGFPAWGAPEYSTEKTASVWQSALTSVFSPKIRSAKIVDVYNWDEHRNTGAVPGIAAFLRQTPTQESCSAPEILPQIPYGARDPQALSWKYLQATNQGSGSGVLVHIAKDVHATNQTATDNIPVGNTTSVAIPGNMYGLLTWYVEADACNGTRKSYSEPRLIVVEPKFPEINVPFWVRIFLRLTEDIYHLRKTIVKA